MTDKLDLLIKYTRAGFKIFPVHNPVKNGCSCPQGRACVSIGKHPRTKQGVLDATSEQEAIYNWHSRWPEANWGIATGEASGVIVLDVDIKSNGPESLKKFRIPVTPTVITGSGGLHYYFRYPGFEVKNSSNKIGPGLDIRGLNGYVVLPPSLHESGGIYEWKIKPKDVGGFRDIPKDLLSKIRKAKSRKLTADEDGLIENGQRNDMLVATAGWMRGRGFNSRAVGVALQAINAEACEKPLREEEIFKIVKSSERWSKN